MPTPTPTPALAPEWRPRANPWLITVAVMLGTFMEVLDTSVANVALPHMAGSLSASTDEATWVLTSYLVANAIVLPITGWLARRVGRQRLLLACIALFTVASFICGSAPSLGLLIVARIIQGAGGGALQPLAQAILLESFPPHKRGKAMAAYALGIVFAPIIGPTVGGWITDNYSWRWIFYINLPVGILAFLMVNALVEDPPYIKNAPRTRIDYIGFGLLCLWVSTLQLILDRGQQDDWFAATWIRYAAAFSALTFFAFLAWELHTPEPIVNLRVLKNRNFATGTFLITIVGIVLYSSILLIPLFLQTLLGYSATQAGLVVSPRGIGSVIAIILVGRFIGLIDLRILLVCSLTLLGLTTWWFSELTPQMGPFSLLVPIIFSGAAVSMLFVPLTTAATATLKQEQIGNATGIYNLLRNIGGAIGISLATTLLARNAQGYQTLLSANFTPYSPTFRTEYTQLLQAIAPYADPVTAPQQAYAIVYAYVQQEAALLAYVSTFRLLAILCFLCIPFLFLFTRVRHGPQSPKPPIDAH